MFDCTAFNKMLVPPPRFSTCNSRFSQFRELRLGLLVGGELPGVDLDASGGGDDPVGALLHQTGDAVGVLDGLIGLIGQLLRIQAVSYTHLDVYKRQDSDYTDRLS